MRENRGLPIGLPALLAVLAILACGPGATLTSPPEETEQVAALVGEVLPDEDVVNHGRADGAISQLLNREILRDGDRLEILEGGVAEVLLVNAWQFFLFNKTRMGVELREGETIQETMLMESGTLLGRREIEGLEEGDEPVIFRLPGDRSIIVSGTRFFIVLGDDTNQAIVGNFDGSVRVEGGAVSLLLPAGEFIRDWGPFQPPDQATQGTITFTLDEFMDWGRVLEEPSGFREVVFKDETDVPTPIDTPTQIPSPTPSFTPTPTSSVTPTPTLGPPMVTGLMNANCRFGPGTVYDVIGSLLKLETVLINGRNASTTWWWIQNPDAGGQCWVWDGLVTVSGDTSQVPVIAAPPLPATATPTATVTPTPTPRPTLVPPPPPPVNPPAAPTGLAYSGCVSPITLTWTDNADNESGYRVIRGGTTIATLSANSTSFVVKASGWTYEVEAFNLAGNSNRASVDVCVIQ